MKMAVETAISSSSSDPPTPLLSDDAEETGVEATEDITFSPESGREVEKEIRRAAASCTAELSVGRRPTGRVGSWKFGSAVVRVGSNLYACLFFVMSRYFEGIYGMAVDNCIIILDG